jgi:3',5'-cyclic AMP phosphodiesterase CpdA
VSTRPAHTLIQISDLHIGPPSGTVRNPVDTFDVLDRALAAVEQAALRPTAVLFTGDLVENGLPEEYRRLRALVEPALARIGSPAVYVAGNHDDRGPLREHLLGVAPDTGPLDGVHWFGELRIVVLDSTVPGFGYGELRPGQLSWLRGELARPAPGGTVLAVHHPPLPSLSPFTAAIELQNRAELAAAIAGSDVRVILAGHTHVVSAGVLAGIPVWTGGAVATTLDPMVPGGALRGLGSPSVSRIDLFADAVISTNVPFDVPTLTNVPGAVMQATVAELRAQLPAR